MRDEGAFEAAWAQFVQEDEATTPPPDLEQRTIAAWEDLQRRSFNRQRPNQRYLLWSVGAAAAALLLAISLHRSVMTDDRASSPPTSASLRAHETEVTYRWQRTSPLQGAVITLAVDPIMDTETLQLVRVRMPRLALQAVGVLVGEPDAEGFVEVDVLVGEDGLPRDVRRVALTQE